jgi:hypothetical protein
MATVLPFRGIRPIDDSELCNSGGSLDATEGRSMRRQVSPVIYTEYHFDDLEFTLLQYTKDMIQKHNELGASLAREDITLCWEIQVRRYFPNGHPERRRFLKQVYLPRPVLFPRDRSLTKFAVDILVSRIAILGQQSTDQS